MTQDDPFLSETRYCDYSNPQLRRLAAGFAEAYATPRERAVAVFGYVRDTVKYEVGNWRRTASYTHRQATGSCTNSANLMVALLRSLGTPAGYGKMSVRGREYFGPIVPGPLSRFTSEISTHIYVWVRLDGEWLRCDPSDDTALSAGSGHLNPQSKEVDWDGRGDAMLNLSPEHIVSDMGPIANADTLIGKRMRTVMRVPVRIGNIYIDFLRQEGPRLTSVVEAQEQFLQWLRPRHPVYHRLYQGLRAGLPDTAAPAVPETVPDAVPADLPGMLPPPPDAPDERGTAGAA
jgi:hypothetical protein